VRAAARAQEEAAVRAAAVVAPLPQKKENSFDEARRGRTTVELFTERQSSKEQPSHPLPQFSAKNGMSHRQTGSDAIEVPAMPKSATADAVLRGGNAGRQLGVPGAAWSKPAAAPCSPQTASHEAETELDSSKTPRTVRRASDSGPPRAWAQVVARWAKGGTENDADEADKKRAKLDNVGEGATPKLCSSLGSAKAPEFVPISMQQQSLEESALQPLMKQRHKVGKQSATRGTYQSLSGGAHAEYQGQGDSNDSFGELITTVMVTGLPLDSTAETFTMQLDSWGLMGTYDFVYVPLDVQNQANAGCAFVNFIDSCFVVLFCWIYQECQIPGTVTPAEVQGLEANRAHWEQYATHSEEEQEPASKPVILQSPQPSQWSVNTVNAMLSPQFREHFRKTKLCVFNRKNRCEMGASCPFAHSNQELLPAPDLAKTKLCCNFFRGRCFDTRCKFAHGLKELRSVWVPYSPGVWYFGSSDEDGASGNASYRPIDNSEMQMDGGAVVGYPIMEEHLNCFMNGGEVPMLGELPPFTQDMDFSSPVDEAPSESLSGSTAPFSRNVSDQQQQLSVYNHLLVGSSLPVACEPLHMAQEPPVRSGPVAIVGDGIALRVRGTFMEAMQLKCDLQETRARSWSDGDLQAFRNAMEETGVLQS